MVRFKFFIKCFCLVSIFPKRFWFKWFGLPFLIWFGLNGLKVHKRFDLGFFYINGFVLFQGKETKPNQNQTGPIATHVHVHVFDQNNMPIASCQTAPMNQG